MQHTQQNCWLKTLVWPILLVVAATPDVASSAPKVDPLLTEAMGPCDPGLDGPDYVAGTDVNGNPVMSADVPAAKVPLPDGILLPLGGGATKKHAAEPQAYAELSRKDVDTILDSKPACPPARKAR